MTPAHPLYPDITLAMIAAELEREAQLRRRVYPDRVATARMTPAEAEWQHALCAAWAADVARMIASWFTPHPLAPPTHAVSWADRRRGLARELEFRARIYPDRVATARMTPAESSQRIRCLEALAAIYDDGFDWIAGNGARPAFAQLEPDEATLQARQDWDAHWRQVNELRHPAQRQGEMQL